MIDPIVTIGLEIHIQLLTKTKLFASSSNSKIDKPNKNLSILDLGIPGTLPSLNEESVKKAIRLGHSFNCAINDKSYFCRKHYFYPDLPKGYQISQLDKPICKEGYININFKKKIYIERMHIEEDAGKSIHKDEYNSNIDLNRAGVSLLEIVTTPCIQNKIDAMNFIKYVRMNAQYLDVCDGNMEDGSLRVDLNISIRIKKKDPLGVRVEVKNLNSIKHLGQAIEYEKKRQLQEISNNIKIKQETRLWNEKNKQTYSMREKEKLSDYKYMRDPDLLSLKISRKHIKELKRTLPINLNNKIKKLKKKYKLTESEALYLIKNKELCIYFENIEKKIKYPRFIYEWLMSYIILFMKKEKNLNYMILKNNIIKLLFLYKEGKIEKEYLIKLFLLLKKDKREKIEEVYSNIKNLEENLEEDMIEIKEIMNKLGKKVIEYKNGKENLLGYFIGECIRKVKRKEMKSPNKIRRYLLIYLKKEDN